MYIAKHQEDLALAQETCTELRSGNNEAILGVYNRFHSFFLGYTRKRIRPPDNERAVSILDDFWVELLNAKAICDYKGLASLKTYLFKILNFRILDNVRRANRQSAYSNNISDNNHEVDRFGSDEISPEKDLMHKEKIKIVHETLLILSDKSPTDAYLVKMHLEGLNYAQMAEKSLGKTKYSQRKLNKKINAIKKRFTRAKTGSLAKFKSCLEQVMRKNTLAYSDLLN